MLGLGNIHTQITENDNRLATRNLRGCFENGQAYVACSRGRSLNSMEVENFNVQEIKTSENVKAFYKSLRETRCRNAKTKDAIGAMLFATCNKSRKRTLTRADSLSRVPTVTTATGIITSNGFRKNPNRARICSWDCDEF